jgi:hypothetical protein
MVLLAGSALTSTLMGGSTGNLVAGGIMGSDNINAKLSIRRVWLEWTSDWGVFKMEESYKLGLGMISNSAMVFGTILVVQWTGYLMILLRATLLLVWPTI